MPRVYPLRTQLNTGAPTDGDDCGPLTIINAIKWASDNKINIKQSEVADWVKKIRRWANKPRGGLYLQGDCYQVYRHPEFKREFTKRGLNPPVATYSRQILWTTLSSRLKRGDFVHLPLDYGTLRSGSAPVGSHTFSGDHYIALLYAPQVSGRYHKVYVWDGDPLFDGRRSNIPEGWQMDLLVNFKRAAGHWGTPTAGYGKCYAVTLRKGK